jgi:hypothetical protein
VTHLDMPATPARIWTAIKAEQLAALGKKDFVKGEVGNPRF